MSERQTFSHTDRLHGPAAFKAIFDTGARETAGPLLGVAIASTHGSARIGISVPKRIGNAVRRNQVKRFIREAFRQSGNLRHGSFDLIIIVRPHEEKPLAEYQRWIHRLLEKHGKRFSKQEEKPKD